MKANTTTLEASTRRSRRRVRRAIGALAVTALGLSACNSNPSSRRVVLDIIESESLANPDLDKECLEKQLEGFSDEDLANIADEEGAAQLAEFKAALSSCLGSS